MSIFTSLPKIDHDRVVAAITAAEQKTSGEIRVVLSRAKVADPILAAQSEFTRLGMANTAARNGVLIFVAPASHNFAVIGDTGIHEKCGDAFWRLLAAELTAHFKRGDFTAGLVQGIEHAGKLLAENFPSNGDADRNELPNDITETD